MIRNLVPLCSIISDSTRCELLSKVDIFDIRNNVGLEAVIGVAVVNCSQKLISLIFGTTQKKSITIVKMLWIALKSWYLWYSEQQYVKKKACRCVVNCSQKLISLIFGTTFSREFTREDKLWIALKSWYLWYSEQLIPFSSLIQWCCELLSKVDIFDIRNNLNMKTKVNRVVVNCSQKLISLIFGTTHCRGCS